MKLLFFLSLVALAPLLVFVFSLCMAMFVCTESGDLQRRDVPKNIPIRKWGAFSYIILCRNGVYRAYFPVYVWGIVLARWASLGRQMPYSTIKSVNDYPTEEAAEAAARDYLAQKYFDSLMWKGPPDDA